MDNCYCAFSIWIIHPLRKTPSRKTADRQTSSTPWKALKKPLLIIFFILVNVVVIAITAMSEFGNSENAANFSEVKINWWFLVPAALCFIVAVWLEIHKYVLMMYEMSDEKKKFDVKRAKKVARRTVLLGRYYDNITPAAVGGQPFQIYYMRKNSNLPSGVSTSIPIFGMISGQIGFIIIAVFCFLFGSLSINNAVLIGTACFGLLFYAFWPITVMIATFLPKATTEIIGLSKLDISSNTTFFRMFRAMPNITVLDLTDWDLENSHATNFGNMFNGCTSLKTIYASTKFVIPSGSTTTTMFGNTPSLVGGNGTAYDGTYITGIRAVIDAPGQPGYFTQGPPPASP